MVSGEGREVTNGVETLGEEGVVIAVIGAEGVPPVEWQEALSLCLAASGPDRLEEGGPPAHCCSASPAAGVVRLWESPYCCNKWFVEGLEVLEAKRRRGIATRMMSVGLDGLREAGADVVYAHIEDHNLASIKTCMGLGFGLASPGRYVNSHGEPRTGGSEYLLDLRQLSPAAQHDLG